MRKHKPLWLMLILTIFCFSFALQVSAEGVADYSTMPVSPQEMVDFLNRINFQSISEMSEGQMILSFAISEQGKIALAVETPKDVQIGVYDPNGTFLYGYSFSNGGSAFVVLFDGEFVSINWAKSGYVGSFDSQGNCIQFAREDGSRKNSELFQSHRNRPRSGTVGSLTYHTEGPWLSWQCWRFVIEDSTGNQKVLHDASQHQSVLWPIGAVGFIGFFSVLIHRKLKQDQNE